MSSETTTTTTTTIEPKQRLFDFLNSHGITDYKTLYHKRVYTCDEAEVCEGLPTAVSKTLFLKDSTKPTPRYWILVTLGRVRADWKYISKEVGSKGRLKFASEEEMVAALGVTPGTATPFALINDMEKHAVQVIIDKCVLNDDVMTFHPLTNDATTIIKKEDFFKFLEATGHKVSATVDSDANAASGNQ